MAPPLSGKTSFLQALGEPVEEFCMDNNDDLYHKVDIFSYTDQSVITGKYDYLEVDRLCSSNLIVAPLLSM